MQRITLQLYREQLSTSLVFKFKVTRHFWSTLRISSCMHVTVLGVCMGGCKNENKAGWQMSPLTQVSFWKRTASGFKFKVMQHSCSINALHMCIFSYMKPWKFCKSYARSVDESTQIEQVRNASSKSTYESYTLEMLRRCTLRVENHIPNTSWIAMYKIANTERPVHELKELRQYQIPKVDMKV